MTGEKVRVTKDDWRYDEWSSRKASKKTRARKLLREDPLEYAKTFGAEAAKKRAERTAGTIASRSARSVTRSAAPFLAATVLPAAAVTGSLAILAAGYVVMDHLAKNQRVKLGERINAISREFVNQQNAVIVKLGARTWSEVPAEIQKTAVANYKRALGTATAQAQGSAIVGVRESYK